MLSSINLAEHINKYFTIINSSYYGTMIKVIDENHIKYVHIVYDGSSIRRHYDLNFLIATNYILLGSYRPSTDEEILSIYETQQKSNIFLTLKLALDEK